MLSRSYVDWFFFWFIIVLFGKMWLRFVCIEFVFGDRVGRFRLERVGLVSGIGFVVGLRKMIFLVLVVMREVKVVVSKMKVNMVC